MRAILLLAALVLTTPAVAHDKWKNGDPVPEWVKRSCCGPQDAHQLKADQISTDKDGWVIQSEGMTFHVPAGKELPSQDGEYWIFYLPQYPGRAETPTVFCFFIPLAT